jgi:membrane-bound lytic murein transglycosylase B
MHTNTIAALTIVALLAGCAPVAAKTPDLRAEYADFIQEMVEKHGFERRDLERLFADVRTRQDIIDAMMRPAEALPWHRYRQIFMTEARVASGVRFWREHADTIARASDEFGVEPEILVAIIGVESNYGLVRGRYPVVEALATLGFDYPPRAAFFLSELEHFLLLAREEGIDPRDVRGSYAGAMGSPQFISSSYRAYAVDFDGSGRRDLWNSWPDIIGSVANYFHQHRWTRKGPVTAPATLRDPAARELATRRLDLQTTVGELRAAGVLPGVQLPDDTRANLLMLERDADGAEEYWVTLHNFHVITRYNRSALYAMAVHQLARAIAERRGG